MGRVTITLPRLGETMEEARVTDWLVPVGAAFRRGDVLLEVETDKTVVEVPALADGRLLAQLVAPGDMVALDQPIAEVEAEAAEAAPAPVRDRTPEPGQTPAHDPRPAPAARPPVTAPSGRRPAASPAARAAARRSGTDLRLISGTGRRGRITAADLDGLTVVLLHGLFDDSTGWRDLPRRLAAAGARVVTPDLPGHGTNTPPASDLETTLSRIAATLPSGTLHLIGHSLGAAVAVRLAQHLGPRLSRLTLLAPAGIGPAINADFTDGMLRADTPEALGQALSLLDTGPMSVQLLAQELQRLLRLRAGHAAFAKLISSAGAQSIDIIPDLEALVCPVSVMVGTADRILDWRDISRLPAHVAVHLVRGAGHLPHHAAPDVFLRLALQGQPQNRRSASA